MDEDLRHICSVLSIGRKTRQRLENVNIYTLDHLLGAEERFQEQEFGELTEKLRDRLLIAIDWRKKHKDANILEEFEVDMFEEYEEEYDMRKKEEQRQNEKKKVEIEQFINVVMGRSFSGDLSTEDKQDMEFGKLVFQKFKCGEYSKEDLYNYCVNVVMQSANLKKHLGNFAYRDFITIFMLHFFKCAGYHVGEELSVYLQKNVVVAGRTQSGKSAVKGVMMFLCHLMETPLIIVTKGVAESVDLHAKLEVFASRTTMDQKYIVVVTRKKDCKGIKEKDNEIKNALENGGVVVLADTSHQVRARVCRALKEYRGKNPGGKFVLTIDEADAMLWRTETQAQQFEKALNELRSLGPALTTYISATPLPFMLKLASNSDCDLDFFNLSPSDNYVGIESTKPLTNENGDNLFLGINEINLNTEIHSIPYANEKVMALYNDALSNEGGNKKGILLLDVTNPRVNVDKNVFIKAQRVQQFYRNEKKDIIVIAFVGRGISVKFPGKDWEHEKWRTALIGEVIKNIDKDYGLDMPVFIFGFSKMRRGISFRSDLRVPTHMTMMLSRGHNLSTVIQTLGRATYNGKDTLQQNGFQHVTLLTTKMDYDIGISVQCYIDEVSSRVKNGESFKDALTGSNKKHIDAANWVDKSFRKTGALKTTQQDYRNGVNFEERTELNENEKKMKEKLWNVKDAQKLFRSLIRSQRRKDYKSGEKFVNPDDIISDLDDMEDIQLSKTKVNNLLKEFSDHMLIVKDEEGWYFVQSDLRKLMNEEFGEIPMLEVSDDDCRSEASEQHLDNEESVLSAISPQTRSVIQNNVVQKTNQASYDSEDVNIVTQETMDMNMSINDDLSISSISFNSEHPRSDESFSFGGDNHDSNINIVSQTGDSATQLNDSSIDSPSRGRGNRGYTSKRSRDAGCTSRSESPKKKKKNQQQLSEIVSKIHKRSPNEQIVTGSYLIQPHFKRTIYYAKKNEGLREIAKKFKVDLEVIVAINKQRENMSGISPKSRISINNSPIVLPLEDFSILFTKPSATTINTTTAIGVGDIPLVNEDDEAVEGSYLILPHKDRMIYYSHDNETPNQISARVKVNAKDIVKINKTRKEYKNLWANAELKVNSPIILPRTLCFQNNIDSIE